MTEHIIKCSLCKLQLKDCTCKNSKPKFPFNFADYDKLKDNTLFINYVSEKIAKKITIIQDFNDGALDKDDLVSILQSYLPKYLNNKERIINKLNNI